MASRHPISPDALRRQFSAGPLARAGWTFERAMAVPVIAAAIEYGARESARAAQINRASPHWSAPPE